jgi:hypothetical protein
VLRLVRVLVLIAALAIVAAGLLAGLGGILAALLDPAGEPSMALTFAVSILALSGGLGLALAWQALQAIRGRGSRPFAPRRPGLLVLLFPWLLLGGYLVQTSGLGHPLLFVGFHISAAALPPLAIVALAGRALGGASRWRDVVLHLGSGAFLSTTLALTAELLVLLMLGIAAVTFWASQPGGTEQLLELLSRFQDPAWLQDPAIQSEVLGPFLRSPLLLALALAVLVAIVPAIEEAVKAIGVPLLAYRRPHAAQSVSWGLMGGAGFALAEGLLNTTLALEGWLPVTLLRCGTTLVHSLAGAIMGLAWYRLLAQKRWLSALGLYGASVFVHGLWNGAAGAIGIVSLTAQINQPGAAGQWLAGAGAAALLALLVAIGIAAALGLVLLVRYVQRAPLAKPTPAADLAPLANRAAPALPAEPASEPQEPAQS